MIQCLILFLASLFLNCSALAQPSTHFAERPDVKIFIHKMVSSYQFKEPALVTLFNTVTIRPTIMKKIKAPLEKEPWNIYQNLFVSQWRIQHGVEYWNQNHVALAHAEKKYGIPASIIVATIGIETKYGLHTGKFRVIDALSNIAFSKSTRAPYFQSELKEFLLLTREQHLDPMKVMGSYAGAMGQPQFMPSSYRRYAVSYNGHSKIDLANNQLDIIASIANFYKEHGWETNKPIAVPSPPNDHPFILFSFNSKEKAHLLSRSIDFSSPKDSALLKLHPHKLIALPTYWGDEKWFGFCNFDVIKRYNASDLYAMSVLQLSHRITMLREKSKNG